MLTQKRNITLTAIILLLAAVVISGCSSSADGKNAGNDSIVSPVNGKLEIPVASVSDGQAHHFQAKASDGTMVHFFVLKSSDGVVRTAIDSCDVCYRSGLGYYQDGDYMICQNCGQKFASARINVIKGGCNPAPLNRTVVGDKLVINMKDIDLNSWYMKYRKA